MDPNTIFASSPRTTDKLQQVITACAVLHNISKNRNVPMPVVNGNSQSGQLRAQMQGLSAIAPAATGLRYREQFAITYFPCMFDLNVPLNKVELHLLATLLDTANSDEIDYTELGNGLQHLRENTELEDEETDAPQSEKQFLIPSDPRLTKCACCKMAIDEPYREKNPKYLQIELRLVTFEKFKHHPGHVHVLVHSHLPVFGLVQLLVHLTSIQSTKIAVFRDKSRTKDVRLPPDFRLEDCGYAGSSKDNPQEIVLYYDYTVEFTDCPILVCDHYF